MSDRPVSVNISASTYCYKLNRKRKRLLRGALQLRLIAYFFVALCHEKCMYCLSRTGFWAYLLSIVARCGSLRFLSRCWLVLSAAVNVASQCAWLCCSDQASLSREAFSHLRVKPPSDQTHSSWSHCVPRRWWQPEAVAAHAWVRGLSAFCSLKTFPGRVSWKATEWA